MIALGANANSHFGTPEKGLAAAIRRIAAELGQVTAQSRFFRTPCFPPGAGPDYVNAAIALETGLEPAALLAGLHRIEADFGRERVERWASRSLDLDLLAYDDLVVPDPATFDHWHDLPPETQVMRAPDQLILPHPRLQDRAFVLVPLAEIAPDWRHPVLGRTVAEMRDALPAADLAEITAL